MLKPSLKDPDNANNYRCIAIASGASKIIEKVLFIGRLKNFNLTSCNQFGFNFSRNITQLKFGFLLSREQ